MTDNKYDILPMNDHTESYKVSMGHLFDMPFRLLICGPSERSGKTSLTGNLLCRFYKDQFKPEDIYIISPSASTDQKWKLIRKYLKIPDSNIVHEYSEEELTALYNDIQEEYETMISEGHQPDQKLIVFDDLSYSGHLKDKTNGIISKLVCNGRHFLINQLYICQKYTDLSTCIRENVTGAIFFNCTTKQLNLIMEDFNEGNKKAFINEFRLATMKKHGIFVVNYSNDYEKRYAKGLGLGDFVNIPI